jgi:hypothetical protein
MTRSEAELDRIFEKFRQHCTYCGGELKRSGYADHPSTDCAGWTVDVWRAPHAVDGDDIASLWAACGPCIMRKADRSGTAYLQWRYENSEPLPRRWVRELGLEDTQAADSQNTPSHGRR